MRIVVTGATGNVGTSLIRALGRAPEVREIIGIATRTPDRNFHKTRFVAADVGKDDLTQSLAGAAAVIHLAWRFRPTHDLDALVHTNVHGARRVFEAAAAEAVPTLIHMSSIGVYARGSKSESVDEPGLRVVRFRPALVFKRQAASHVHRVLLGGLVPRIAFDRRLARFLPIPEGLAFQCVHTSDVAEAIVRATLRDVRGAFNLAAAPLLGEEDLRRALNAGTRSLTREHLRHAVEIGWRLHLQPTDAGLVDLAYDLPAIDSLRARRELDWVPRFNARETLAELLVGLRHGDGFDTPVLQPRPAARRREAAMREGARPVT
jgi:nucleoside-diphosphate-sugar epimerase